jgi:1-pyrroline-5-carboxylate dehydrogenase
MSGISNIPSARNEPVLSYAPGSDERAALKAALKSQAGQQVDIPVVVGGQ